MEVMFYNVNVFMNTDGNRDKNSKYVGVNRACEKSLCSSMNGSWKNVYNRIFQNIRLEQITYRFGTLVLRLDAIFIRLYYVLYL